MLVYVGDLLFTEVDSDVKAVKTCLMEAYQKTVLGESGYFLGVEIERGWVKGTVQLHHSKLIRDALARFYTETSKSQMTPMALGQEAKPKGDVFHRKEVQ
jgi:hypothetical protein